MKRIVSLACILDANADTQTSPYTTKKLKELTEFLEVSTTWFDQISRLPTKALVTMLKLGGRLRKKGSGG